MSLKTLILLLLCAEAAFGACPAGYGYHSTLTLPVPASTQTDIPLVAAGTLAGLKTVANGGGLVNTDSGQPADFILLDTDFSTNLGNFHFPEYSATTGAYQLLFNYPSLTTGGGTLHACFGKASVTTFQGNIAGTYNSAYKLVAHMEDNAASTTVLDSTTNAHNGTQTNNTSGKTVTGKLGAALNYAAATDQVSFGNSSDFDFPAASATYTFEFWINLSALPSGSYTDIILNRGVFTTDGYLSGLVGSSAGKFYWANNSPGTNTYLENTPTDLTATVWYHVAFTFGDGGNDTPRWYLNGVANGNNPEGGSTTATRNLIFAATTNTVAMAFDEIRVSNVARSANWIAVSYANQNSPMTLSAPESLISGIRRRAIVF